MIVYSNPKTNELLYDTNMLREILNVSKSFLVREILKYNFNESDYVKYKNLFLYKEGSVMDFINHLIENRLINEINYLKKGVIKNRRTDEI
jgi:hypothetical protein